MIQIRHGVFETNSSSVHSMVICNEDDYEAWVNGDVLLNRYHDDDYVWQHWDSDRHCYVETTKGIPPMFVTKEQAAYYDPHYPYPKEHRDGYYGGWGLEFIDADGEYRERKFITFEEYENSLLYDFEGFNEFYRTEHGDNIVVFGYWGRD